MSGKIYGKYTHDRDYIKYTAFSLVRHLNYLEISVIKKKNHKIHEYKNVIRFTRPMKLLKLNGATNIKYSHSISHYSFSIFFYTVLLCLVEILIVTITLSLSTTTKYYIFIKPIRFFLNKLMLRRQ